MIKQLLNWGPSIMIRLKTLFKKVPTDGRNLFGQGGPSHIF